jgi:maltose-binding protein MalE
VKKWIKNIAVFIIVAVLSLSLVSCSQATKEKASTNANSAKTEVKATFPLRLLILWVGKCHKKGAEENRFAISINDRVDLRNWCW